MSPEQGRALPARGTCIVLGLLWAPCGSIGIPDALGGVQGQPRLMSLGSVARLQEMMSVTARHTDGALFPPPQLHTYLAGRALPLFFIRCAVFLVSKCLQLSQIQHGLDHHLQGAHTPRPTPPRTLTGVRGDVAGTILK